MGAVRRAEGILTDGAIDRTTDDDQRRTHRARGAGTRTDQHASTLGSRRLLSGCRWPLPYRQE
jgi:hypothetical protein